MSDQFVAEIRIFAGNFPPRGWAFCNGQLMAISQNTALFSLLGTTYGGDGRSTFALPDLQDRAPMRSGQGPGLSERFLGESSGSTTVTLLESEIPQHRHQFATSNSESNSPNAAGNAIGSSEFGDNFRNASNVSMANSALATAGGSFPHNNMQPYLGLNFIIALQGIFPQRG